MALKENKSIVRRWIEARNAHDLDAAVALFADDWRDRVSRAFNAMTAAFPDAHITAEEMIAEGDKVVARWTLRGTQRGTFRDIPATGRSVAWSGIDVYTVVDGRIAALVREADNLALLQQLGARPPAASGSAAAAAAGPVVAGS